jgi:hypothetical protein
LNHSKPCICSLRNFFGFRLVMLAGWEPLSQATENMFQGWPQSFSQCGYSSRFLSNGTLHCNKIIESGLVSPQKKKIHLSTTAVTVYISSYQNGWVVFFSFSTNYTCTQYTAITTDPTSVSVAYTYQRLRFAAKHDFGQEELVEMDSLSGEN